MRVVIQRVSSGKVNVAGETEPSPGSELVRSIVTVAVGWLVSATVKLSVPPISVVVSPEVGKMVNPAVSSSIIVPRPIGSSRIPLTALVKVIVNVSSISSK